MALRAQAGPSELTSKAFERSANAFEALVRNEHPHAPNRGFRRTIAAAAYHLAGFSAVAYSLFKEAAEDLNASPGEAAIRHLILRDLGQLRGFVREWLDDEAHSDEQIAVALTGDDLHQRSPGERDKLYGVLARISRDTAVPVVRQALTEILSDCPPMLLKQDRRPPPGELTSRGTASVLGVPPGEVGRLVDAGFLTPLSTSGTRRKQYLFDASFVEGMRAELTAGMSARHAAQLLGLPLYAIPQLLALNVLQPQPSELSMFLRGDHRVRVEDLEAIAGWISALPLVPPAREWVSLSEAFTAVGGRDKPWATVIKAALSQELPGGLITRPMIMSSKKAEVAGTA